MPLSIPSEIQDMLDTGSIYAVTSLDVVFGGSGAVIKHLSTERVLSVVTDTFGEVDYDSNLRVSGQLNQSLTISVDRMDLTVQNVDLVFGGLIVDNPEYLNGAKGILSIIYISNGIKKQLEILHGQISNASSEDTELKCQLVSYLSLSGPLGGWRPLMKHCGWRFKFPGCDSTDPSSTCSHLFEDSNGCSSKTPAPRLVNPVPSNNQGSFGGYVFKSVIPTGSVVKDPKGIVDEGNDFNTYTRNRDGWEGRHVIPSEHYGL
jgi:hypothetical protein